MSNFVHLHNHTHYSLLDAACTPEQLIKAAEADGQTAIALTDHGVMYGCYEMYKKCTAHGIKPILGFEAYVAMGSRLEKNLDKSARTQKRNYYHLILLAKDLTGYHNLMKLCTLGHTEGFYYRPRIDREIIEKYKDGLIVSSACLAGVVSKHLIAGEMSAAIEQAKYYHDLFGDDFYLELQNHGLKDDPIVLEQTPKIAKELGIKMIATNDIHYIKREHAIAHNIMLMINKENVSGDDIVDIHKLRYGTDQFYFKTSREMEDLFSDFPDAIANTAEIADKCSIEFKKKLYMPVFPVPPESSAKNLDEYFTELAWKGFAERYPNGSQEYKDRLQYEIDVIVKMGFPGYFLIVQDFVNAAKYKLGVSVGPGRGSAAGSMVAYCLQITNVDPMPYDLLFERFLNPDRVSMPDIDMDFADTTRERVIDYVKEKYGADSVAQIITFGKLSCKAVLKDVGRVLGIPHTEINQITAKIPTTQGKVMPLVEALELPDLKEFKENNDPKIKQLIEYSILLEGMYRHSSVHAAGVAIAPSECSDYVPLVKKDKEMVAQFTMKDIEDAGLVKMDFLGLRTLTIIDYALELIERNTGEKIDLSKIDFYDPATYDLFSRGDTLAVFQFESKGMQEYLMQLKPKSLEDITAMNALYRPGPMENIPDFIDRKWGRKKIEYLHPIMASTLDTTYGIIIYQEQVMQLVQVIAGFTLGRADLLRRAMGKKDTVLMEQQRADFITGAATNGVDAKIASEIFDLIQKFAKYGFNKSHSLAYSYLAFQTAWLKAHYPAEFLAANMTAEKNSLEKVVELIEGAATKGIKVLPPDINTSTGKFVASGKQIYFGMSAIKNVGEGAVESIVEVRKNGPFTSFFDFVARADKQINKRVIEALICVGAFDSLNPHRAILFEAVESALNYAKSRQNQDKTMDSLFGGTATENIPEPQLPDVPDWPELVRLEKEKEYINFYVSGHPLNQYKACIKPLSHINSSDFESKFIGSKVIICGIVSSFKTRLDKNNNTFAFMDLEDFHGKVECAIWSRTYAKYSHLLVVNTPVMVIGKSESDSEKIKIQVDEMLHLSDAIDKYARGYRIKIDAGQFDNSLLDQLNALCGNAPKRVKIVFDLYNLPTVALRRYAAEDVKIPINHETIQKLEEIFGKGKVEILGVNN